MTEMGYFIMSALGDPSSAWRHTSVDALARLQAPDGMLGGSRGVLKADIYLQWARWFVEGIADPRRFTRSYTYPHVYQDALQSVNELFSDLDQIERNELASQVAKVIAPIAHFINSSEIGRASYRERV